MDTKYGYQIWITKWIKKIFYGYSFNKKDIENTKMDIKR